MKKGLKIILPILLIIAIGAFWLVKSKPQNTPPSNLPKQQTPIGSKIILTYSFTKANQMPVIVANQKNLFKKNNLDVEIQQVEKNATSVLTSGKADLMISTPQVALPAVIQGSNLVWIGSISNDSPTIVVSFKNPKEVKTVASLSGPSKTQALGLLQLAGVNTDNLTIKEVSENQAKLVALQGKQVEAIHIGKPDWLIFKKKANLSDEYKIILDSATEPKAQMPIGIIVRNEFLAGNKKAVIDFSKAIIEADSWIKNNKDDFIQLLTNYYSDMPQEAVIIQANAYLETLSNLQFTPSLEKGKEMLKLVEASNPKAKDYDLNNFISTEISDSLKKEGFLDQFDVK